MKTTIGLYVFTDHTNGLCYVGKSASLSYGVEDRIHKHYFNKREANPRFHNALRVRPDLFSLEITPMPGASDEEICAAEVALIAKLDAFHNGYNETTGGEGGSPSEATKCKLSEARQGEKNPMYGKPRTDEAKRKISEAWTDERKAEASENVSERNLIDNPMHNPETVQKVKDWWTPERKADLSENNPNAIENRQRRSGVEQLKLFPAEVR